MIDPKLLHVGDLFIVNAKGKESTVFSDAIRDVTRDWTHAALDIGNLQIGTVTENLLYESELENENNPSSEYLENNNYDYMIWRLINVPQDILDNCAKIVMQSGIHTGYGIPTILWFGWRWVLERFGVDTKGMHNFFPGRICSEEVFYFLVLVAGFRPEVREIIKPYNRYTVAPGDLVAMFEKSVVDGNNVFGLIDSRTDFKNYPNE